MQNYEPCWGTQTSNLVTTERLEPNFVVLEPVVIKGLVSLHCPFVCLREAIKIEKTLKSGNCPD